MCWQLLSVTLHFTHAWVSCDVSVLSCDWCMMSLWCHLQDESRKTRTEVYILIADRLVETWEDKTDSTFLFHFFSLVSLFFASHSLKMSSNKVGSLSFLSSWSIRSTVLHCLKYLLLPLSFGFLPICSLPLSLPICSLPLSPVDRQRRWFPVDEAITITSRRPLKQNYLIAACNLAAHRREQLASPPTSSPHHSLFSLPRRSAILPVALTCILVCCASAYCVFMFWLFFLCVIYYFASCAIYTSCEFF